MRKKIKALLKNQKGFTLVELLAVIVILGIIGAIAVPSIAGIIDNSKKDAHIANAQQMVSAARLAVAANDVTFNSTTSGTPAVTTTTSTLTLTQLTDLGYLETGLKDPDGGNYTEADSKVVITKTGTGAWTYAVSLVGSEREIGDATHQKSSTGLTRADVEVK